RKIWQLLFYCASGKRHHTQAGSHGIEFRPSAIAEECCETIFRKQGPSSVSHVNMSLQSEGVEIIIVLVYFLKIEPFLREELFGTGTNKVLPNNAGGEMKCFFVIVACIEFNQKRHLNISRPQFVAAITINTG